MTRLLFAFLGIAALQLVPPHLAETNEYVDTGADPSSVVVWPEAESRGAITRVDPQIDVFKVSRVTQGSPAQDPRTTLPGPHLVSPAETPLRLGPAALLPVLSGARAPPA